FAQFLYLDKARKVGDIAVHAVEAFGDNERIAIIATPFPQQEIEMIEIIVPENNSLSGGTLGSANNAVVRQLINEKPVVRTKEMRNRRHIGEIAAYQRKSCFNPQEFCK